MIEAKYYDREETPLKWHKLQRYIRLPFRVLTAISSLIISINELSNGYTIFIPFVCFYIAILYLTIKVMIGFKNWDRKAIKLLIYSEILTFLEFTYTNLLTATDNTDIAIVLLICPLFGGFFCYLEYRYYMKRRMLFTDANDDNNINEKENVDVFEAEVVNSKEIDEQPSNEIVDNPKQEMDIIDTEPLDNEKDVDSIQETNIQEETPNIKVKYCRFCGYKLEDVAIYCSKCGNKVR